MFHEILEAIERDIKRCSLTDAIPMAGGGVAHG